MVGRPYSEEFRRRVLEEVAEGSSRRGAALRFPPARRGGNRRHVDERAVVNELTYILSTGCQWRAIPKDLPARSAL